MTTIYKDEYKFGGVTCGYIVRKNIVYFLSKHMKIMISMIDKIKKFKRRMTRLEHGSKFEVPKKNIMMALLPKRCTNTVLFPILRLMKDPLHRD